MSLIANKWNPGDLLSAEKLNSHLQHCNICVVNINKEYDEGPQGPILVSLKLNKTVQELLQILQTGDYVVIKDNEQGLLYLEMYGFSDNNNMYYFSFYPPEVNTFTFTAENLTDYPQQGGK